MEMDTLGTGSAPCDQSPQFVSEQDSFRTAHVRTFNDVLGTSPRGSAGMLRIDFPHLLWRGRFQEISWDE